MRIIYPLPQPAGAEGRADLAVNRLAQCFVNTTASYKFFWFLALLRLHAERTAQRRAGLQSVSVLQSAQLTRTAAAAAEPIYFYELAAMMTALAWYPCNVFRLQFGSFDQLSSLIAQLVNRPELCAASGLPPPEPGSSCAEVYQVLRLAAQRDLSLRRRLLILCKLVPTRFLSPWFPKASDSAVKRLSCSDELCLYQIRPTADGPCIVVNAAWADYLAEHQKILEDFTLLALVQFAEKHNPTVPNIVNKLQHPLQRSALTYARHYFAAYFADSAAVNIYRGNSALPADWAVDHFIPWNFVGHNELWNLAPIDQETNSRKSDKLPDLDQFLEPLIDLHYAALRHNAAWLLAAADPGSRGPWRGPFSRASFKTACDSLTDGLRIDAEHLTELTQDDFGRMLGNIIRPLYLQALNLHFETWQVPPRSGSAEFTHRGLNIKG